MLKIGLTRTVLVIQLWGNQGINVEITYQIDYSNYHVSVDPKIMSKSSTLVCQGVAQVIPYKEQI